MHIFAKLKFFSNYGNLVSKNCFLGMTSVGFFFQFDKTHRNYQTLISQDFKPRIQNYESKFFGYSTFAPSTGLVSKKSLGYNLLAHIFSADPRYVNQFSNGSLSPDSDAHSTYFVIDPTSGIPLTVVARFQVNMFIEPIKGMTEIDGISLSHRKGRY